MDTRQLQVECILLLPFWFTDALHFHLLFSFVVIYLYSFKINKKQQLHNSDNTHHFPVTTIKILATFPTPPQFQVRGNAVPVN